MQVGNWVSPPRGLPAVDRYLPNCQWAPRDSNPEAVRFELTRFTCFRQGPITGVISLVPLACLDNQQHFSGSRKVEESNPYPFRYAGFQDQLPTTEPHLPC